jgi:hypothetical protein
LVLITFSLAFAGCHTPTPTITSEISPISSPTTPPPVNSPIITTPLVVVPSTATPTVPIVTPPPISTSSGPTSPEIQTIVIDKPVPASYITYSDPNGLFRISYPGDWEIPPDQIQKITDNSNQVYQILNGTFKSSLFLGNLLFSARVKPSYPIVNFLFLPGRSNPEPPHSLDSDLYKTSVGGRDAMMVEDLGFDPDNGTFRRLILVVISNGNTWRIECSARPDDYDKWANDFKFIAGSLRILK